ncbi:DUF1236 domain-containing protein [Psychromarinibacter halotolerans]|uniref:DUF1236 domain-containing protein n=1 Tax=Psychromarinibacter halotolerans TaxID=1775175 RepID=A0ABV7GP54_9RHOB|nr:DUF1236 domain-containing protein [Psychromarinibacter halotolerans]MAQ86325.1 hypothetical protein [Maritimibacter sp.]MDF0596922.1 DUF1236 domain-containing protein [Psychromarinibacter halotolerans]
MFNKAILGVSATAMMIATGASAQTMATAATDLNLRAGPGPNYAINNVIDAEADVTVLGCLEASNWCEVSYNGEQGWAYGDYLATQLDGEYVAVYPNMQATETTVVTYDETAREEGALALGSIGAGVGALAIGGPAAIVGGLIVGAATGATLSPEEKTVTYIQQNPVEPVFVNGEVVMGATVPGEVTAYQVPDADYEYINLNGRYVLVQPDSREIVYIADF